MNITVTVKWDGGERFEQTAKKALHAGLTRGAINAASFMRNTLHRGIRFSPSSPGMPPNVQRGGLLKAITHNESKGDVFRAAAGAVKGHPYAKIQEYGGTIRARSGHLAIPINIQAKRLTEQFGRTTEYFEGVSGTGYLSTGGLRNLDLVVVKTPKQVLLMGKKAIRQKIVFGRGGWLAYTDVPVWVLKKSVTLPARPWCAPAVKNNEAAIQKSIRSAMSKVFSDAGYGRKRVV